MDFRVLGPLEIMNSSGNIAPTAPKSRQVISLLIMRRNRIVRTPELISELWGERPPSSAMTTLQTYIYKLRQTFTEHGAQAMLETRPGGYLLAVPDPAIDLHRFERAAGEGRSALRRGDPRGAAEALAGALATWRGPALADVVAGDPLAAHLTWLEEARLRTLELRIETDLRLGRHAELIGELKSLAITHPLHERFHASLMLALHRSGRRSEAVEVYHALRRGLMEELGLEPGEEARRLYRAVRSPHAPAQPAAR